MPDRNRSSQISRNDHATDIFMDQQKNPPPRIRIPQILGIFVINNVGLIDHEHLKSHSYVNHCPVKRNFLSPVSRTVSHPHQYIKRQQCGNCTERHDALIRYVLWIKPIKTDFHKKIADDIAGYHCDQIQKTVSSPIQPNDKEGANNRQETHSQQKECFEI